MKTAGAQRMERSTAAPAATGGTSLVGRLLTFGQLLLVTAIWGGGFVAAKFVAEGLPPFTAATARTVIAAVIFIPLIWGVPANRPKLHGRDWLIFGALSLLGYSLLNVFYFTAFQFTSVTQASLIWGAVPLVTALLAALLIGEQLTRWILAGVVLTTVGVALVVLAGSAVTEPGDNPALGNLLIGVAMLLWVLYSIVAKIAMRRHSPLTVTATACTMGALTLLPIAWLTDWQASLITSTPLSAWLGVLYSGAISLVISYVLWIDGIRRIGATRVAIFTNLSPVWALIFAAWLLGEIILPLHLVGGALILAGVWLANRTSMPGRKIRTR